jgi:hypothetical protein
LRFAYRATPLKSASGMSQNKSVPPRITIAPEFSAPGSLVRALQAGAQPASGRSAGFDNDTVWTVLGVSALWQTAAENAARRTGVELGDWLRQAINDAVAAEGITLATGD